MKIMMILWCVIFVSLVNAMEHEVTLLEKHSGEDKTLIDRDEKPLFGSKIVSNILKGGYCLGVTALSGLGGYGAVELLENQTALQEGRGAIAVGATIGFSICFLGVSLYWCGKSLVKNRKIDENTQLETEEV